MQTPIKKNKRVKEKEGCKRRMESAETKLQVARLFYNPAIPLSDTERKARMRDLFQGKIGPFQSGRDLGTSEISDKEFHIYQDFILITMRGSGFMTRSLLYDYMPFENLIRLSWKGDSRIPWTWLYRQHRIKGDNVWPVVEEREGRCMLVWVENGVEKTDWTELTEALVLAVD
jgi:hypothetical protein